MTALDQATPATASLPDRPFVLVTVGTDHHPFDRLVDWVDRWVADRGPGVACVIQYGTSSGPVAATGTAYLEHDVLVSAMSRATAVVCHGGPGTILEARAAGHVPIVVPRSKNLGEHVDDHQVHFSRRLADSGEVVLVGSADALAAALDRAIDGPKVPTAVVPPSSPSAVDLFAAAVDDAVARRPRPFARSAPSSPHLPRLTSSAAASPSEGEGRVPVLLIAGMGRSGSTLLDRLLGEVDGCVSLGEVVHLWSRGLRDDERCACGERFSRCPFWTAVGEEAFGGWGNVDVAAVLDAQRRVERDRHLLQLVREPGAAPTFDVDLQAYADSLLAVYRSVQRLTGARWLVDSSKHVATAYLLRRLADVDLRVVHLVRDPRGVAYSWTKVVPRPEVDGRKDMARWSPTRTATRYLCYNTLLHPLGAAGVPSLRVRYESLVVDPQAHLEQVLELIDMPDAALPFLGDGSARLGGGHTIGGNPMRFQHGDVPLRLDDRWRQELARPTYTAVTALTAPLLAAYGYVGRRSTQPEKTRGG